MRGGRWQHFPHQADIGVEGIGEDIATAFVQAALALTAVICDPVAVESRSSVAIRCTAPDAELLLVDWLNALIYEMATRHMLFSRFELAIDEGRLEGQAWGEPVDAIRHQPAVEVKGATYTELKVYRDDKGMWHARCVVDV